MTETLTVRLESLLSPVEKISFVFDKLNGIVSPLVCIGVGTTSNRVSLLYGASMPLKPAVEFCNANRTVDLLEGQVFGAMTEAQ
ncbi:hypothetical protein ACFPVX_20230 [Cohnella faecalis]|uniref:Uncharacterized protein n=1 Tax=Cohnella faecalis TaxID=2315694 RepID=A0A398CU65_9BACL|nr:hypothetical protein [Cohnella faecalis]RIE04238.1 hypothetical protein D3H35_06370 [Cohnella faecalis]